MKKTKRGGKRPNAGRPNAGKTKDRKAIYISSNCLEMIKKHKGSKNYSDFILSLMSRFLKF